MRFTFRIMLFCMSLLLLLQPSFVFAKSKVKVKVGDKVPNFTLEGIDGKQYELKKMKGKVVVLVMASRKLDEETDHWLLELHNAFKEEVNKKEKSKINIFEVADMRSVPRFMPKAVVRRLAKKFMQEEKEKLPFTKIILFDWKQKVNKLLGAEKDKVDIFVIDKKGILAHHQVVPYSKKNFPILKSKVEETLKSDDNAKIKK